MKIPIKQYNDLFGKYLRPHWKRVSLLVILMLGGIAAQTINPQVMRYFIDTATDPDQIGSFRKLIIAALIFMGIAIFNQLISVASIYLGEQIGWFSTNALREDLARHCLGLKMSFHNAKTPGEMIERIDGDVANLASFFSRFIVRMLSSTVLLIAVLALLFREDLRVGVAMGIYAMITLALLITLRNFAVPFWKDAREASSDLFGFLEEFMGGTEDIRSSGAVDFTIRRLYQFTRERLRKEFKAGLAGMMMWSLTDVLYSIGQIVSIVMGYFLFREGLFTIGTVILVMDYTDRLFRPLRRIAREMEELQKASASIVRVQELFDLEDQISEGIGVQFPKGALSANFNDVIFSYNESEIILDGIDFRLDQGEVLGLLGRTGSGKTTISRLLFRLYEQQKGEIRLGDHDIRSAKIADLRNRVGMVTQNVQIFRASVRDNLTFFDHNISDDRIIEVINSVGLDPWFRSLENGLDSQLESGGKGLSAGEGQLLTFARVFLKDPGLVILDEASSRLDPATEQQIEKAIDKLLQNRTAIIIAHRLATVNRADKIMIIGDGEIEEFNYREKLINDPSSRFSQLLKTGLQEVLS